MMPKVTQALIAGVIALFIPYRFRGLNIALSDKQMQNLVVNL